MSFLHTTLLFDLIMSLSYINIIELSQTVLQLRPAQDFGFRGDNYITKKELSVLHVTYLLVFHFIPTKYYILSQTVWELWPAQDFGFSGGNYTTKKVRLVSCTGHAYWSSSLFLPIIIKIYLRVSKLWSAQGYVYRFCFRGDNYIMKKVRVVSLARNKPSGPSLHPYQIPNYLKQYGSYGLHKTLALGKITT